MKNQLTATKLYVSVIAMVLSFSSKVYAQDAEIVQEIQQEVVLSVVDIGFPDMQIQSVGVEAAESVLAVSPATDVFINSDTTLSNQQQPRGVKGGKGAKGGKHAKHAFDPAVKTCIDSAIAALGEAAVQFKSDIKASMDQCKLTSATKEAGKTCFDSVRSNAQASEIGKAIDAAKQSCKPVQSAVVK